MIAYRSTQTAGGGQKYAAKYTGIVNNNLVKASAAGMFNGNYSFNSEIFIGDNVAQCSRMLEGCSNFNSQIHFGKNVINAFNMFFNCTNFNLPFVIGNKMVNISWMLHDCSKFNHEFIIPDSVEDCSGLFFYCHTFNSNVKMSNNTKNCARMFAYTSYNRPITIPETTEDCWGMFGDSPFNQDIVIPERVNSVISFLSNAYNFGKNIYIKGLPARCMGLVGVKNRSKRVNIFCTDASHFIGQGFNSIVWPDDDAVWTEMSNGYYNSTYNVYIYGNYSW